MTPRSALALISCFMFVGMSYVTADEALGVRPAEKTFEFLVLDDANGQPLAGATIRAYIDSEARFTTTDSDGKARVPRPDREYYSFMVDFWKEGYIQERKRWSDTVSPVKPIPESFTGRLKPGVARISGKVVDEQRDPVAGATVYLSELPPYRKDWKGMISELPVVTDKEGRWSTGSVPPDLGTIFGYVRHPEFIEGRLDVTPARLLAGEGNVVLKRGVVVVGRVIDEAGLPIAGASIRMADRNYRPEMPHTESGKDGRFRMANVPEAPISLIISGAGRTPELETIEEAFPGEEHSLLVRLAPGRLLKGRVVDSNGRGVVGAMIATQSWNRLAGLVWRAKTDSDGRFVWDSAPADEVRISASKIGYAMDLHGATAGDAEQTWVLRRSIYLHGTVTDAGTGAKIPRFEVDMSEDGPKPEAVKGAVFDGKPSRSQFWGRYDYHANDPRADFHLVFSAQGYQTLNSRRFGREESEILCDFKLTRLAPGEGGGPTGIVLGFDGKPLKGADVLLGNTSESATLINGEVHHPEGYAGGIGVGYVTTGEDGTFTFSPIQEDYYVAVAHEQGFTRVSAVDLVREPKVRIRPWGRIEGQVAPGPGWAPDVRISAHSINADPEEPFHSWYRNIRIDQSGQFVIERVPPGLMRVELNRVSTLKVDVIGKPINVEAKSGQTSHIEIEGS